MMLFGDGLFGRWLGHETRTFMNEINAFTQEPQSDLLQFGHLKTQQEGALYEPTSRLSPDPKSASVLILYFPASRIVRKSFLFLTCHPVYGIYYIILMGFLNFTTAIDYNFPFRIKY